MSNATIPAFEQRHRLRLALDHSDVSVEGMAEELGVSRNTVGNYLAGRTQPSVAVLRVWALRTGVPFDWLRYGVAVIDDPDGPGTQAEPSPGWVTADENGSFGLYLVARAA